MKKYVRLLTIAGSDSGGGAGIQADLKTFSALACYGMSVITALTAQNTMGVTAIYPVTPDFVKQQLDAVLSDIGADAIKIGMLSTPEVIKTLASSLTEYKISKIVLDPVMVAKSGDKLLQDNAIEALIKYLFPHALIITPNLSEAEVLTKMKITNRDNMLEAGKKLLSYGCQNIILKGSFYKDNLLPDLFLAQGQEAIWLESDRIDTVNNHGTGCTLSSAIASYLGQNFDLLTAVKKAKEYITQAIADGSYYRLGHGKSPVNHFFNLWK
ncbi:bifunctional hydroxymethylpyrimidine kinase/phosphomethylpyrimidine kinase [bacterium]|nr:bifunctional hydroxymethylpyrimidine kinase/phosphomethylpyrimidine kinase [bacterium]